MLGWSRKSNEYNSEDSSSEAKRSILLLGDSVTQGDGLEPQETYPYLLSRKLAVHDVKSLNAGSSGYGIDQMLFKGLRESHKDRPDLILFSFIPHDLIRVGKNFMYGRGKPKIIFDGDVASVQPAVNAELRHVT